MRKIKIYFGTEEHTMFGTCADIAILEIAKDKEVDGLVRAIIENKQEWFGVKTLTGTKYIHIPKIVWFEVDDANILKMDGIRADITHVDDIKGDVNE